MRNIFKKIKGYLVRTDNITTNHFDGQDIITLNKELSDRVNELKVELTMGTETMDLMKAEVLRQSQLRQQAEDKAYRLESRKSSETSINSDAINDKLIMQGVLFRAREVARDMVPLLADATEALLSLPAPETEEQEGAIATLNESLHKVNRYANMLPNDGGGENLLITQGMMEEKAKATGESTMQSDEAEALKLLLKKEHKAVVVLDLPHDQLLVQLQAKRNRYDSFEYRGEFYRKAEPEFILARIAGNIAAAQAEHAKDCVPEGSDARYDEDGFKKRCMNDDGWPSPKQAPEGNGMKDYDGPENFEELWQHGETRP